MKHLTLILVFFAFSTPLFSFAQGYKATVVRLKNGSAFIEFQEKRKEYSPDLLKEVGTSTYPMWEVWVGPQTLVTIQNGVKKAIEWARKNKEHQMEFEKEIVRFRVMTKQSYELYRQYISEFTEEGKLVFYGSSDGSFQVELDVSQGKSVNLDSISSLESFLKILQGKSANKEIDQIFN